MKKRVLAFILSAVLLLAVMPLMTADVYASEVRVGTAAELYSALSGVDGQGPSTIILTNDITFSQKVRLDRTVTLRGGYTIILAGSDDVRSVEGMWHTFITVNQGGHLILDGPTIQLECAHGALRGVVVGRGAYLTMLDGEIWCSSQNIVAENWGVHVGGGTFTMKGGAITRTNAAVYVWGDGEVGAFIMKGGEISGNVLGVALVYNPIVTITGGVITDNVIGIEIGAMFTTEFSVPDSSILYGNRLYDIRSFSDAVDSIPPRLPPSDPPPLPPNLSTASTWAQEGISEAIGLGIVPETLQNYYTNDITRAEFTAIAVLIYETITGREITGRVAFNDTDDINVQKAAYIRIISGTGNNYFSPDMQFNREQAAVIVSRLAAAIGQPFPEATPEFTDNDEISSWALEQTGQVQSAGIMEGIGSGNFNPHGTFTREQSIITMLRLFHYIS